MSAEAFERQLIGSVREGDLVAYRVLFDLYVERLVDFAYGYTRAGDTSREIVHDVFIGLWEKRAQLEIHGSVGAYLFRATRNRALNVIRDRRAHDRMEARIAADVETEPPVAYNLGPEGVESQEFLVAVRTAVEQLSPRLREVFLLSKEQGLAHADIAAVMGISVAAVTVQLSRALRRLHEILGEWR